MKRRSFNGWYTGVKTGQLENYHSEVELAYMQILDGAENVAMWRKRHGIQIGYMDRRGKRRRYWPDFMVVDTKGKVSLVELTGTKYAEAEEKPSKAVALRAYCAERGWEAVVLTWWQLCLLYPEVMNRRHLKSLRVG